MLCVYVAGICVPCSVRGCCILGNSGSYYSCVRDGYVHFKCTQCELCVWLHLMEVCFLLIFFFT